MRLAEQSPQRLEVLADALRRFVRRGSRSRVSNALAKMRPEDVSLLLRRFTPDEQVHLFEVLNTDFPESAGDVLLDSEPSIRRTILQQLSTQEVGELLAPMPADDAVSLIESLPTEMREEVLELIEQRDLADVQSQLSYEDDSAGRIMDPQCYALPESTTVREAIEAIQEAGREIEMIFYLYVVDSERHLVGVASLRQLLLARPVSTLGEIMNRSVIKVATDTDQEDVAELATRYNLLAIPVTDDRNRLVGVVTVDDLLDIVQEEATEDFYKMVGTSDDELEYEEHPMRVARIRFPWLAVNLVGLAVSGWVLHRFQIGMTEALFLLTFVPAILGMGGNIGSQTSTIAVRALATGRIGLERPAVARFVRHQVTVGMILGLACALIVCVAAIVLEQNPYYALVVGVSLFLAMVIATLSGALVPVVFERLGIDPAVASAPLVTTSNDITGVLIYFGLASLLIELLIR